MCALFIDTHRDRHDSDNRRNPFSFQDFLLQPIINEWSNIPFDILMYTCIHTCTQIHYNIGKLLGDAGKTDDAVERYRHAIQ